MQLLITAFLLTSFSALACPDLSGKWATCRSKNGILSNANDMVITQKVVNGVTAYQQKGVDENNVHFDVEILMDGLPNSESEVDVESGELVTLNTDYSCKGNSLISEVELSSQSHRVRMKGSTYKSGNLLITEAFFTINGVANSDTLICE